MYRSAPLLGGQHGDGAHAPALTELHDARAAGIDRVVGADAGAIAGAELGAALAALELGDHLDALDINPLICGPDGAVAVDVLAEPAARRR